jgi:VWFA-related protein
MTRAAALGTLALAIAPLLAGAQTPATSPAPAFPARAEAVTVDVVVLDKDGTPVAGLDREEFTILEDGVPQAVTAFESVALPEAPTPDFATVEAVRPAVSSNSRPARAGRTLVVVFDDAHLTVIRGEAARKAVEAFLGREARPGDRVTLVPTSGGAWWTTVMPQGAEDLARAMARLKGLRVRDASARQMSDYEALRIFRYRDENIRNQVFTRLIEMDQIADPDSGPKGGLKGLNLAPGKAIVDTMAAAVYSEAEQRMKATLDLLERVLSSVAGQRGHKTVLLVSEGFVHDPQVQEFAAVARRAAEANAEVDFVDARSLESDLPTMADAEIRPAANPQKALDIVQRARLETQGSESIALDSGGLVVRGGNDLAGALGRAARASRAYYLLGYQPTNPARDGKFRRIEVKVRRPGLGVRARKGYYAPSAEVAIRRADALDPDVQRALDAPEVAADIPLRLAAYRLAPPAAGKTKVRLTAEVDPAVLAFDPTSGRSRDTLDTFFFVASRDTGGRESHHSAVELDLPAEALARLRATWLPLQRDFELASGVYQARLAVLDANIGRVASVVHDFEVPAAGGLGFTSPVLTDTVIASDRPGEPPRPALIARRTFAAGTRLYCQFEVTGAAAEGGATRVRAGHELRRADGRVLAHLDPTPMPAGPGGRVTRLLAISLRHAEPGEHELVLTARDEVSGKEIQDRETFVVATVAEAAALGAVVAVAPPPGPRPGPPTTPALPPVARDAAGLQSLVTRYGTAGRESAVLDLASWPTNRLKEVVRGREAALAGERAVDAALLLTESALLRVGDEHDALAAAGRLLAPIGDSAEARDRRRRWALAVSAHFLDQSRLDQAREWAEDARKVDPGDAAALVARGVVDEVQATIGDPRNPLRPAQARGPDAAPVGSESLTRFLGKAERDRLAVNAEDLYTRALEREPQSAEAHLRRGRLLALRGRVAEASADLEWVAAHASDARLQAVAHLLLARQADAQGQVEAALRQYAAALERAPGALSALVGRSELLARSGHSGEAADALVGALSERRGADRPDPWLTYHLGFHARTAESLTSLRVAGRP